MAALPTRPTRPTRPTQLSGPIRPGRSAWDRPRRRVGTGRWRRPAALVLGLAAAVATVPLTAGPAIADAAPPPLPLVTMAAVVLAAQVEPTRGDVPALGDDASTRLVQQALVARGFRVAVGGVFGRQTVAAYTGWQRRLGYTGINANGIPGTVSLSRLGAGRFAVDPTPGTRIAVGSRSDTFGGRRVNTRTRLMLEAADARLPFTLRLAQGSYCALERPVRCVKASAGTHDGGGAIDVSVRTLSETRRWQTVAALRAVGFAAWYRTADQCSCWTPHIHAIAIGDTDLWQRKGTANRDQVAAYLVGRDGLSRNRKDNTPRAYRAAFTTWEAYQLALSVG